MTDLQASVTTNVGQTTQAMGEVKGQLDGIEKATKKAHHAGREYQSEISEGMHEMGKVVKEVGAEFGKMTKSAGSVLGKAVGSSKSDIFTKLAIGAGLFSVAMKAGEAVMEAQLDRTEKLITAKRELNEVELNAIKIREKQGLDAHAEQSGDLRTIIARGGRQGLDLLKDVTKGGGVSDSEARKGVSAALLVKNGELRDRVIQAALAAARAGEGSFSEHVSSLVGDRRALSRLGDNGAMRDDEDRASNISEATARLIVANRHQIASPENLAAARNAGVVNQGMGGSADLLGQIEGTQGQLNRIGGIGRDRIASGEAQDAARKQAATASDPLTAGLVELTRKNNEQISELRELAKAQGRFFGFLANVFQPGGSFETQIARLQNAQAGAQFGNGE